MPLIAWNKALSMGSVVLDGQHAQLLEVFSDLHAAMVEGKPPYIATAISSRLVAYTGEHFRCEEQQMADARFAGLESHRRDHGVLLTQAAVLHVQLLASNPLPSMTTLELLKQWLLEHIDRRDRAFGEYLVAVSTQVSRSRVVPPKAR